MYCTRFVIQDMQQERRKGLPKSFQVGIRLLSGDQLEVIKIVCEFRHDLDNFKSITGQQSDTDLTRLWEALAPLLLQILYDETGAVHNLIGFIRPEAAYVSLYGEAFP